MYLPGSNIVVRKQLKQDLPIHGVQLSRPDTSVKQILCNFIYCTYNDVVLIVCFTCCLLHYLPTHTFAVCIHFTIRQVVSTKYSKVSLAITKNDCKEIDTLLEMYYTGYFLSRRIKLSYILPFSVKCHKECVKWLQEMRILK